jgi:hypothetical protein
MSSNDSGLMWTNSFHKENHDHNTFYSNRRDTGYDFSLYNWLIIFKLSI